MLHSRGSQFFNINYFHVKIANFEVFKFQNPKPEPCLISSTFKFGTLQFQIVFEIHKVP